VSIIEIGHLACGEVLQVDASADVERRLVQVLDEEMNFGSIRERQRDRRPCAGRIESAGVVPGAEEPEGLRTGVDREEAVDAVYPPDEVAPPIREHFPPEVALEVNGGAPLGTPALLR